MNDSVLSVLSIEDPVAKLLGAWSANLTLPAIFLRLALAVLLAAVIGWERSNKRHSAGFRTFILMSMGAASAMMLDRFAGDTHLIAGGAVVAMAIISVNSMLFSSRNQIKGLTTSVALWVNGIIGLTAGAGFYTVTLAAFVVLLLSLSIFPAIETYFKNRSNHFEIHLELKNSAYLQNFVATIRKLGLVIDDIELNPAYAGSGLSVYSIAISISSAELKKYKTHSEIIEALRTLDYVHHVEEMRG